jgi:hypothetical protein
MHASSAAAAQSPPSVGAGSSEPLLLLVVPLGDGWGVTVTVTCWLGLAVGLPLVPAPPHAASVGTTSATLSEIAASRGIAPRTPVTSDTPVHMPASARSHAVQQRDRGGGPDAEPTDRRPA